MAEALQAPLRLRVHRMEWAAEGVLSVELRRPEGSDLPAFTPGAHLDLHLPNGLVRNYSLTGDPAERHRYTIGVGLDAASRGGSAYIHTQLRVGQVLPVAGPRNNFPLVEDAPKVVLIAGGIGVTPLFCMAKALAKHGRRFSFYYSTRTPERAAFLEEIRELGAPLVAHFDSHHEGRPMDLAAIVQGEAAGTHFYCCGPGGMLAAFEQAAAQLPPDHVHVEYFAPKKQAETSAARGFTVVLARGGKEIPVAPEQSVLDALLAAGVKVESSCQEGICGTCEVHVVEGEIDHRCSVLSKVEREAGKSMMVCVSRCKGERLVLDLAAS